MGVGVFTAVIGIVVIVSTMGAATPLVVAGGVVGFGTSVYGLSNAGEGIHNIQLGNAGDIQTKSYNLIRDTAFMGNDKLYHEVGNVFVTTSAIMIPIGQTQSVVQGLTEFAIGEAGAYTAGQAAYYGTKFAGGSEEDAQTANFIGNIVGGYAASSAASKFSLNKVKVDVEVPKYNREQIPRNIEESRPTWRQSELDVGKDYEGYDAQKSFINGEEVPYGTKGSVRPEFYKNGHSVEVKNYNVETSSGRNSLINNVSSQIKKRLTNLPEGTEQTVVIDVRGQEYNLEILRDIKNKIIEKSGYNAEILFKRE